MVKAATSPYFLSEQIELTKNITITKVCARSHDDDIFIKFSEKNREVGCEFDDICLRYCFKKNWLAFSCVNCPHFRGSNAD